MTIQINNYQKQLLTYLSEGKTQKEIAEIFKKEEIDPRSLSSIEKNIKKLKETFEANTNFHLAIKYYEFKNEQNKNLKL